MRHKTQRHQHWSGGLVGAALTVALGLLFLLTRVGQRYSDLSYDLPFAFRPDVQVDGVVIVYVDEDSYRELGQQYSRWSRELYAQLLNRLKIDQALLVVFDVLFLEPNAQNPEQDLQLAGAVRNFGKVVLAAERQEYHDAGVPARKTLPPIQPLIDAGATWGIARVSKDADYSSRRHSTGAQPDPALTWKAAELFGAGVTRSPSRQWLERWINYYGPAETIPGVSFRRALKRDEVGAEMFRNKVVFIGARPLAGFAGEQKEEFPGPYTWQDGRFLSGVEIHATTFLNLIRSDWLVGLPRGAEIVLLVLSGTLFGYGLTLRRPLSAVLFALAGVVVTSLLAFVLVWQGRIWFSWLIIVGAQIPAALAWSIGFNSFRLYLEKRLLQHSLALHVAPARVKQLLRNPALRRPGGEQQTISILFSDIADFSRITARMHPDDLFKLLNKYFEASLACIHHYHGTIVKLTGDGIFAIWNAPVTQAAHQELACRAALRLREQLIQFDAAQRGLPLRTRVGLHSGLACVGNVGSATRFDYTAIGDSVNLASRLEGLNKHLGTDTLATREVQRPVESMLVSRPVGFFRFKGFDQVVEVTELIGGPEAANSTQDWRNAFEASLRSFERKDFDGAERGFSEVLTRKPQDGPSTFYLKRLAQLRRQDLPPGWFGEIDLDEK